MIGTLEWQRPQSLWLSLTLIAITLAIWIMFNRRVMRGLPVKVRSALFFLRVGALIALELSLSRPVLSLHEPSTRRGIVAIMVDESASMSVVDTARSPADLVPLAAALDADIKRRRDPKLEIARQTFQSLKVAGEELSRFSGEMDYARLSQRSTADPARNLQAAVLKLANSRDAMVRVATSMRNAEALTRVLDSIDVPAATTRPASFNTALQAAEGDLALLQQQSDQRLLDSDVEASKSVDALVGESRIQLVKKLLAKTAPSLSSRFSVQYFGFGRTLRTAYAATDFDADQPDTDLTGALGELRYRLAGQRVAAIIVCSDGQQNSLPSLESISSNDLPVFAVNPAAAEIVDIAIDHLNAPRSVWIGKPASASVVINSRNPTFSTGTLSLAWQEHANDASLHFIGPTTRAVMSFTADKTGPLELIASINPQPHEATLVNNIFDAWTRVADEPIRVGLLCRSSDDGNALQSTISDPLVSVQKLPLLPGPMLDEAILQQDLIILQDLPYDSLTDANWWAIQQMVRDRGGSILIASTQPSVYADYAAHEPTSPLLAWSPDQTPTVLLWPGDTPTFRLLPAGNASFKQLMWNVDPDLNRQAWRQLPSLLRVVNFPDLLATAEPLMVEAQTRSAVFATHELGIGRVGLIGTDEWQRWRSPLLTPEIFWQAMIQNLSGGSYAVDDGILAMDVDSLAPQPDQTLKVRLKITAGGRAELNEAFDRPLLQIQRDDKIYFSQFLNSPPDALPMRYQVELANMPAGDYRLNFTWADRKLSMPMLIADSLSRELSNVAADPANLATIVSSRGNVLPLEELPDIVARIEMLPEAPPGVIAYPFWDSPYFFIVIVCCFGADWALRQRFGLA